MNREQSERKICAAICQSDGLKAKDIARQLNLERSTVNRVLYASPLLKDLCYQDDSYRWHGIIRQSVPHDGLYEFSGYYAKVSVFLRLTEDEWMNELMKGCQRIGRNLNDTRGLLHSFRDCREQMINLFADLRDMLGTAYLDWEIVFEFRLKRARYVRIYADVLVITENKVFSLEFKMKDKIDTEEISQAAKYVPYLEIVFGTNYDVIPALVLTKAKDYFDFAAIGRSDSVLPVCSGDIEQGKNCSEENAKKLCAFLGEQLNDLFDSQKTDATLSPKTILHHHRLLSSALTDAVMWGHILNNPCNRVRPPRVKKTEPRFLDEVEAQRVFELLEEERIDFKPAIRVLVLTGCRRGELLGLHWSDVDFEQSLISFKENLLYTPETGKPLNPDSFSKKFIDFIKAHQDDLPYVSVHSMRHTNATLMISSHVAITTVAARLGHANTSTTAKIYAHAIKSADEAAAETLEDLLNPNDSTNTA